MLIKLIYQNTGSSLTLPDEGGEVLFELGGEAGDAEVGGNATEMGIRAGQALEISEDAVRNKQELRIRDIGPSTGAASAGAWLGV